LFGNLENLANSIFLSDTFRDYFNFVEPAMEGEIFLADLGSGRLFLML
jgi:hypothetical protein